MKFRMKIPGLDNKKKDNKAIPETNTVVDSDASSENLVTGNTTTLMTFFNLYKAFAGTAYLSMASAFKHIGIYGGIGGLIVIYLINMYTMHLQLESVNILGLPIRSYSELGKLSLGPGAKSFLDLMVLITHFSFGVAMLLGMST